MNDQEIRNLRRFFKLFKGFDKLVVESSKNPVGTIPWELFLQIEGEITSAVGQFPEIMPKYNRRDVVPANYVFPPGIRAYLARAISNIEPILEENAPIELSGPSLSFAFIRDPELKRIIERDYPELLLRNFLSWVTGVWAVSFRIKSPTKKEVSANILGRINAGIYKNFVIARKTFRRMILIYSGRGKSFLTAISIKSCLRSSYGSFVFRTYKLC